MITAWGPWVLSAVGIVGIWLAGRRSWKGWALGLGAQSLWLAYAFLTGQLGFIASAMAYGCVYGWNLWKWLHPNTDQRAAMTAIRPHVQVIADEAAGIPTPVFEEAGRIIAADSRARTPYDVHLLNPEDGKTYCGLMIWDGENFIHFTDIDAWATCPACLDAS